MTCGGSHLGFRIGIKKPNFLEHLQMIIPGQFGFNCPSGLREEMAATTGHSINTGPYGKIQKYFLL
jgi:hypothetical protein